MSYSFYDAESIANKYGITEEKAAMAFIGLNAGLEKKDISKLAGVEEDKLDDFYEENISDNQDTFYQGSEIDDINSVTKRFILNKYFNEWKSTREITRRYNNRGFLAEEDIPNEEKELIDEDRRNNYPAHELTNSILKKAGVEDPEYPPGHLKIDPVLRTRDAEEYFEEGWLEKFNPLEIAYSLLEEEGEAEVNEMNEIVTTLTDSEGFSYQEYQEMQWAIRTTGEEFRVNPFVNKEHTDLEMHHIPTDKIVEEFQKEK